jgi:hypothetical protein
MSVTEPTRDQFIDRLSGHKFNLIEATNMQKFIDENYPTGRQINWVNVKTGISVSIGYNF